MYLEIVAFSSRSTMVVCDCTTLWGAIDKANNILKRNNFYFLNLTNATAYYYGNCFSPSKQFWEWIK